MEEESAAYSKQFLSRLGSHENSLIRKLNTFAFPENPLR